MSNLDAQKAEVAYLNDVDPLQRVICAERDCPITGPLSTFQCWRVWRETGWRYFAFCGNEHALTCLPATAMGKG